MLVSYQGIVKEDGLVQLLGASLPVGVRVVVVAPQLLPVEQQIERLEGLSSHEWREPFDEFVRQASQEAQPEVDIDTLGDDDLVKLVHESREEMGG